MNLTAYLKDNMVVIPEGHELMRDFIDPIQWISTNSKMAIPGTHKEKKSQEKTVFVPSFLMLQTPVTNELYNDVMDRETEAQVKAYPVVNVSWLEAVCFCNKLSEKLGLEQAYTLHPLSENIMVDNSKNGFRLPTDEEWQYACRGKVKGYRYGAIEEIAWFQDNAQGRAHEVKTKKANEFGLFDMLGNVWEWCFDLYDVQRYGNYRIFRGGSFASEERACGATSRRKSFPEFKIDDLGFRVVQTYHKDKA